jgi:hypothetical protein
MVYRPLRAFVALGTLMAAPGVALGLRYIYFVMTGQGEGNIQSLILAAILLICGFFLVVGGLLADLISINRKLLEDLRTRIQKIEYDAE